MQPARLACNHSRGDQVVIDVEHAAGVRPPAPQHAQGNELAIGCGKAQGVIMAL